MEISVIIPCYNTGSFLNEALESVYRFIDGEFEIVIVNDGSNDLETLRILNEISDPRVKIINQENLGLATARNVGGYSSNGDILFFLDSDNRILSEYSKRSLQAFAKNANYGVVYGDPVFFGEVEYPTRFKPKVFNFDELLCGNFIDACAFVRKEAFLSVGGFSVEKRLQGWDDWDFWIKVYLQGWDFFYIPEKCFEYRVRRNSMIGSSTEENKDAMMQYLGSRYGFLIHKKFRKYFRIMDHIQKKPFVFFFRILYYKYILKQSFIKNNVKY